MIVHYREFVFPPYLGAKPCVVGCALDWGVQDEKYSHLRFSYLFAPWLGPLANYLYRQQEAMGLTLENLEEGLGVYEGRGYWLEVKEKEGSSKDDLRRWFLQTYVWALPEQFPAAAPATEYPHPVERAPVLAVREQPDTYEAE